MVFDDYPEIRAYAYLINGDLALAGLIIADMSEEDLTRADGAAREMLKAISLVASRMREEEKRREFPRASIIDPSEPPPGDTLPKPELIAEPSGIRFVEYGSEPIYPGDQVVWESGGPKVFRESRQVDSDE